MKTIREELMALAIQNRERIKDRPMRDYVVACVREPSLQSVDNLSALIYEQNQYIKAGL